MDSANIIKEYLQDREIKEVLKAVIA